STSPLLLFFFFQAEDGIRDRNVTGVQTCALPIYSASYQLYNPLLHDCYQKQPHFLLQSILPLRHYKAPNTHCHQWSQSQSLVQRSEERRVGKECRSRRTTWQSKEKR